MSNPQQNFSAGQAQAKTQQAIQTAKDTAHQTRDAVADAAQTAQDSAQAQQRREADQNPGFLQQTGAQVKGMAQGAMESVKNTLGMNEKK